MSIESLQILLVGPEGTTEEFVVLLEQAGVGQLAVETQCDAAMAHVRGLQPDVVLLVEGFAFNDCEKFVNSLCSGKHVRPVPTVLIPIKEEAGFRKDDEFPCGYRVQNPVSSEKLVIGIEEARRRASTQRISAAMDMAIESFVCDAMQSLTTNADTVTARPAPSIPEQTTSTSAREVRFREETAVLKNVGHGAASPWREPTAVLHSEVEAAASVSKGFEDEGDSEDFSEFDESETGNEPSYPAVEGPNGSEFAQRLREKMSKMAQRLFPGQPTSDETVHLFPASSADTEFELSAGGIQTTDVNAEGAEFSTSADSLVSDSDIYRDRGGSHLESESSGTLTEKLERSGSFGGEEGDAASLVTQFWRSGFGGCVTFRDGGRELRLDFENGHILFVASKSWDDRMGELLIRQGKVNEEQLKHCQEQVSESGRRMGEVLVELGYLKPRELLPAVRQHLEDLFYSLFAWTSGQFEAISMHFAEEKIRLSRHPAALVVEGIRRKYSRERITEVLGGPETVLLVHQRQPMSSVARSAELTLSETKAHVLFTGENSLMEIASQCNLPELRVAQLAYAWVALGEADIVSGSTVVGTQPGRNPDNLVGDSDLEIDRERVLAKHRLVKMGSYYQVLGVRTDASAFEIRRAYESARRAFASDALPFELRKELGAILVEIEEAVEEAFAVLQNDAIRQQYREHLCDHSL